MNKKFDLDNRKRSITSWLTEYAEVARLDGNSTQAGNMIWYATPVYLIMLMVEGTVCDYNTEVLRAGNADIIKLVNYSLTTEEWRTHKPHRPEAWVSPNLALIDDRWWREGVIDKNDVAAIFDRQEDWAEGSILVGIDVAERLLSIGAYHLVEPMQHTVNSMARFKRDFTPADRLGLLLASDPSQLHDPKSPARKSARSIMKRNMESRWFMEGHTRK